MASPDQSIPTNDDDTTGDITTCPLCAETASEQDDIYRHLMVTHRKSELSRLVLAFADTQETVDIRYGDSHSGEETQMVSTDFPI